MDAIRTENHYGGERWSEGELLRPSPRPSPQIPIFLEFQVIPGEREQASDLPTFGTHTRGWPALVGGSQLGTASKLVGELRDDRVPAGLGEVSFNRGLAPGG